MEIHSVLMDTELSNRKSLYRNERRMVSRVPGLYRHILLPEFKLIVKADTFLGQDTLEYGGGVGTVLKGARMLWHRWPRRF